MAVPTYDASGTLNNGVGSVLSWTHTVGAGVTSGIIQAYVFDGGTATPNNMSYNGTAMTLLKSGTQTGDPISAQFWYFLNPPTGLGTIKGTYSGTPSGGEYDALSVSYSGVNQTTPFAGSQVFIGTNNSTGGSVAFTSLPANAITVAFVAYDNNTGSVAIGTQRGTAGNGAMVLGADSSGGTVRFTNTNNLSNLVVIGAELQGTVAATTRKPNVLMMTGMGS